MNKQPPKLFLVMPAYNEQASLRKVVLEWFQELENWTENFVFLAIDDGSQDNTLGVLQRLKEQLGDRLEIHSQENRGHGQSCLEGYKMACERGAFWVFQIDSDGQCDPQYFYKFWRDREKYDVIYGHRVKRDDGFRRVLASLVLKAVLFATAGVCCVDANVPYRLMKTKGLEDKIGRIPHDFFLSNVALAVLLKRDPQWRHGIVKIKFSERYGGEPSVALGEFGARAVELVRQLGSL